MESLTLDTALGAIPAIRCGDAGPAVVLCAGLTGSMDDYRQVLPLLAAGGFRAYAYDYAGHYGDADDRPNTIARHGGDLATMMASVDDGRAVHVVGHSIGGFMARAAALARPDLVRSLTMIGCGPATGSDHLQNAFGGFEKVLETRGIGHLWPVISRIIPVADDRRRNYWRHRLDSMRLDFLIGLLRSAQIEPDRADELRKAPFRTLLMRGSRDGRLWKPGDYEDYAERAGAELAIVEKASHSPMLERPEGVATPLLDFWRATDQRRAARTCFEIIRPRATPDPYPKYAELRSSAPVLRIDLPDRAPAVVLTRYADCHRMLNDRDCHALGEAPNLLTPGWNEDPFLRSTLQSFAVREGPVHRPVRRSIAARLTPKRVEALRAGTEEIVDRLLDDLAGQLAGPGPVNLTDVLAVPFASLTVGQLFGIGDDEALRLGRASGDSSAALEPFITPRQRGAMSRAGAELLAGLEPQRTGLAAAVRDHHPDGGEACSGDLIVLFGAAHDSPASLVSAGTKALLENPAEAQRLRDDPALGEACVAEILRYEPPVQIAVRVSAEHRRFGDVDAPPGTPLLGIIAAANRDPAHTDDPDAFRIGRELRGPSLSFGAGRHYCPGAALTRMQAAILFPRLLHRFPGLRLAGPARYRSPGTMLRRVEDLPVTLEA